MVILTGFCPVCALKNRCLYISVVKLSAAVGVPSSRDTGDQLERVPQQLQAQLGSRGPGGQGEMESCSFGLEIRQGFSIEEFSVSPEFKLLGSSLCL